SRSARSAGARRTASRCSSPGELTLLQVRGAREPGWAPEMEPGGGGRRAPPGADSLRAGRPARTGQAIVSSRLRASVRTSRIGDAQALEIGFLWRPSALSTSLMAWRSFAIAFLSALCCAFPLFPSARATRESAAANFFRIPAGTDCASQTEGSTELRKAQVKASLPVL